MNDETPIIPTPLQPGFDIDINDYYEYLLANKGEHVLQAAEKDPQSPHLTQYLEDLTYVRTGARSLHTYAPFDEEDSDSIWPGWLPKGSLVLLEAPLGGGKTLFCADLAARLSCHGILPDGQAVHPHERSVLLISNRQHPYYRMRPTLSAAGASLQNVYHLDRRPTAPMAFEAIPDRFHSLYGFTFSESDFERLTDAIHQHEPSLVIVDDIATTMGNHPKASERFMSQTLLRLNALAIEHDVTFLLQRHIPAPGASRTTMTRAQQTPTFVENAHVCLQLSPDPDYPNEAKTYLLSCSRYEGGDLPQSLRFRVVSHPNNPKQAFPQWDQAASPWTGRELHTYARLAPPNALQREILDILAQHSPKTLSAAEIYELIEDEDEKEDTVSRSIRRMEEKGRIRKRLRGNYELLHPPIKSQPTPVHPLAMPKTLSESSTQTLEIPKTVSETPLPSTQSLEISKIVSEPLSSSSPISEPKTVSKTLQPSQHVLETPKIVSETAQPAAKLIAETAKTVSVSTQPPQKPPKTAKTVSKTSKLSQETSINDQELVVASSQTAPKANMKTNTSKNLYEAYHNGDLSYLEHTLATAQTLKSRIQDMKQSNPSGELSYKNFKDILSSSLFQDLTQQLTPETNS